MGDSDDAAIEAGRRLFAGPCTFVCGVPPGGAFPDSALPEVAFAGRSNVGKSSLLNALTGRTRLARISNTPGRTRQLNFFDLGGRVLLVDLPGYGYARAAKRDIAAWNRALHEYLAGRVNLIRLFLLIDARHGLKAADREMMDRLDPNAVVYQLVLTKCDKLPNETLTTRVAETERAIVRHPAAFPHVLATSARAGSGLERLRAEIATLAADGPSG